MVQHARPYELGSPGALLVRPDGHIAARWPDRPQAPAALAEAFGRLTGVPV
ncbi:hypothetical protein [Streptomyces sp. MUSC 14]|uniref:aromatic-ring hydroxylase C-terminal domain-containing protein n=1 Tax=Streptomyces sp. MUSC 14 TaxID=1354889 RepID=UPI0015A71607|nr:hypothetical protein [Streptomyces sp. MUSC 14]